jgi:hypothetical protein
MSAPCERRSDEVLTMEEYMTEHPPESILGVTKKHAHAAIQLGRRRSFIAFYRAQDKSINAFVTKEGRDATRKALESLLEDTAPGAPEWPLFDDHAGLEALQAFVMAYGRSWRRKLFDFWAGDITQKALMILPDQRSELQSIRNTPGCRE